MLVRLALEEDFPAIVEMAHANIKETRPDMEWDEVRCIETCYSYLETAEPTIFVVEHQRKVIGFLLGSIIGYRAAAGHAVTQEVLYVRPANRGTRASTLLMKNLVKWADQVGAREIIGGVDNNFQPERTAKFLEHFGFERVGYALRKVVR
jgi:L-amino acid N-acyltransferase YncA